MTFLKHFKLHSFLYALSLVLGLTFICLPAQADQILPKLDIQDIILPEKLTLNVVDARVDMDQRYGALILQSHNTYSHKTKNLKDIPVFAFTNGKISTHNLISKDLVRLQIKGNDGITYMYEPILRDSLVFKDYKPVLKGEAIGIIGGEDLKLTKIYPSGYAEDFEYEIVVTDNYANITIGDVSADDIINSVNDADACRWAISTNATNWGKPRDQLIDHCKSRGRYAPRNRWTDNYLRSCCNSVGPGQDIKAIYFSYTQSLQNNNGNIGTIPVGDLSTQPFQSDLNTNTGGYAATPLGDAATNAFDAALSSLPTNTATNAIAATASEICPAETQQTILDAREENLNQLEGMRSATINDQIDLLEGSCFDVFQAQIMGPIASTFSASGGSGLFSGGLQSLSGSMGLNIPSSVIQAGGSALNDALNNAIQGQLCGKLQDMATEAYGSALGTIDSMFAKATSNSKWGGKLSKAIGKPPSGYIESYNVGRFFDPSRQSVLDQQE